MTPVARPWLPQRALGDNVLPLAVAERADAWARHWFSDPKASSVRILPTPDNLKIASDVTFVTTPCEQLALGVDGATLLKIGSAALNVTPARGQSLNVRDGKLLREVATHCIDDLLRRAGEFFCARPGAATTPAERRVGKSLRYGIAFAAGGPAFDLFATHGLATSARKALAAPLAEALPLSSRTEAIGRQSIRIGAMLGASKVALSDFYALSCGDVLVLDRHCKDSVDMTINGEPKAGARCELWRRDNTGLELRLTQLKGGIVS